MSRKFSNIFLGLAFIAAAIFLLLEKLALIPGGLNLWTIFWTVVFIALLISSVLNKNIYIGVFSLAFLVIIYRQPLHLMKLGAGTILVAALLVGIGLSMIFKNRPTITINDKKVDFSWSGFNSSDNIRNSAIILDDDNVVIDEKLSSAKRIIHSSNLKSVTLNAMLGNIVVDLRDATPAGSEVIININGSISDIDILIPRNWAIRNELASQINDISVDGGRVLSPVTTLILRGSGKVSDIDVIRR